MYGTKAIQFAYDGIAELKAKNPKLNLTAQEAGYVLDPQAEIFYQSCLAGIEVINHLVNHIKSSSPAPSLDRNPDLSSDGVIMY
ncbi:hypothetical protein CO613_09035 [Lysobacteraceae bacterium NML07-0707]|nr:hypothetical protein CO613_09035 [Xanthomonadaceae bacterium NML07-0707]